jgi:hypothetical protein
MTCAASKGSTPSWPAVQVQPPPPGNVAAPSGGFSDPTKPFDMEELQAGSAVVGLTEALGLGPLLRRQVRSPLGMLPGLSASGPP